MGKYDFPSHDMLVTMNKSQLATLANRMRSVIISSTAKNGGHLASNLGMVEATIALHRVFDAEHDHLVFDVGHQCYAHKLLTGRADGFSSLRSYGGMSGFPSPLESGSDPFYAGHCGASLSAALGLSEYDKMTGSDAFTVAVIGDAAFSNGMVFEAMNNCVGRGLNLIILLNDNTMSIDKSVGGLSSHLKKMRTDTAYFAFKHSMKAMLGRVPVVGRGLKDRTRNAKDRVRRALLGDSIFESMGLDYLGPVDGHDEARLEAVLREAKMRDRICVVHMVTEKGKGFPLAETSPERYHSVGAFDPSVGVKPSAAPTFSSVFGSEMCSLAARDDKLVAITAAMCDGTGLTEFHGRYPERFFDVGIEEEHAVAFSGGLGVAGLHPVFAVYSTFLQRTYDQVFHDVALQRARTVLAIDRAGLVGGDGVTHQGIYDVSMLSSIPGISIYSPDSFAELRESLDEAVSLDALTAVRYPRGGEPEYDRSVYHPICGDAAVAADYGVAPRLTVITYGRITAEASHAAEALSARGTAVRIIRLKKIYPVDAQALLPELRGEALYLLEEGIESGGVGEKLAALLLTALSVRGGRVPRTVVHAVHDRFVPHGDVPSLFRELGFDSVSLEHRFAAVLGENIADGERLAGTESNSGGETDGADADAPSVTGKEVD